MKSLSIVLFLILSGCVTTTTVTTQDNPRICEELEVSGIRCQRTSTTSTTTRPDPLVGAVAITATMVAAAVLLDELDVRGTSYDYGDYGRISLIIINQTPNPVQICTYGGRSICRFVRDGQRIFLPYRGEDSTPLRVIVGTDDEILYVRSRRHYHNPLLIIDRRGLRIEYP